MYKILWLDDTRNPQDPQWSKILPSISGDVIWVKTYHEFDEWITLNGFPDAVCFDHDLGTGRSGMDAARLMVNKAIENKLSLPIWIVQSANPVGKLNIALYLRMYEKLF